MPYRVHVDIVSAEEQIFSGEVELAVFRGKTANWVFCLAMRHCSPGFAPGAVRLKLPDREEFEMEAVSGGILEVQPTLITLLADTAIRAKDSMRRKQSRLDSTPRKY